MYILHIETSTPICSIALSYGNEIVGSSDLSEGMNHTAILTPAIGRLLDIHTLKPSDLSAISVSSGPGSYTGLRVGCSTAKAMAYTLGIPILAVPTLLALAYGGFKHVPSAELALPMLDARRNEVYLALYSRELNELVPPSSFILDESGLEGIVPRDKRIVISGDGSRKARAYQGGNLIIDESGYSSATHLIEPAYKLFQKRLFSDPMHFVPFYLKPPNITRQRKTI